MPSLPLHPQIVDEVSEIEVDHLREASAELHSCITVQECCVQIGEISFEIFRRSQHALHGLDAAHRHGGATVVVRLDVYDVGVDAERSNPLLAVIMVRKLFIDLRVQRLDRGLERVGKLGPWFQGHGKDVWARRIDGRGDGPGRLRCRGHRKAQIRASRAP